MPRGRSLEVHGDRGSDAHSTKSPWNREIRRSSRCIRKQFGTFARYLGFSTGIMHPLRKQAPWGGAGHFFDLWRMLPTGMHTSLQCSAQTAGMNAKTGLPVEEGGVREAQHLNRVGGPTIGAPRHMRRYFRASAALFFRLQPAAPRIHRARSQPRAHCFLPSWDGREGIRAHTSHS